MDLATARRNAAERLRNACKVCKHCDGAACAGQIPGFGGVGTGSSFVRNVEALASRKLNLRVLHDARDPNTRLSLFGQDLSMPILGAAIAGVKVNKMNGITERELASAMVVGACLAGTLAMSGDGAHAEVFEASLAAAVEARGAAIPVVKPRLQDDLMSRVERARDAGATAIAVDVDAAGLVNMALLGQTVEPKTWKQISEIVQMARRPVVLKGIMTPEDAAIAVDAGAAGIVVSNHGGRALDHTPGTADVLPGIADAVNGRVAVLVDGGVRSGVDVLKMLALGADAVLIGRPLAVAAVGGGAEAVRLQLEEYGKQLRIAMMLTGCRSLSDVTSAIVE